MYTQKVSACSLCTSLHQHLTTQLADCWACRPVYESSLASHAPFSTAAACSHPPQFAAMFAKLHQQPGPMLETEALALAPTGADSSCVSCGSSTTTPVCPVPQYRVVGDIQVLWLSLHMIFLMSQVDVQVFNICLHLMDT